MRDDDYRLSFLQGTFVTLTNVDEHDLERIAALRLSPLFVSLHAWDDDVRARLMGASSRVARDRLAWLAAHGIEMHVQIVLCPGINDGAVLRETVTRLLGLASAPDDAAPTRRPATTACRRRADGGRAAGWSTWASCPSRWRGAGGDLRRVTPADAAARARPGGRAQAAATAAVGRRFVHAADELYLRPARCRPPATLPPSTRTASASAPRCWPTPTELAIAPASPPLALLGGTASAPVLAEAARRLDARTGAAVRPFIVDNALFGPRVTVTGLLGGREVLAALRERPLAAGEWLLAPRTFLPAELGRTLDDVTESRARGRLRRPPRPGRRSRRGAGRRALGAARRARRSWAVRGRRSRPARGLRSGVGDGVDGLQSSTR